MKQAHALIILLIQLAFLTGLSQQLRGNILVNPTLINAKDARLSLSLSLNSALGHGETFQLGPFNEGSIRPTPITDPIVGDLQRCTIKAPRYGIALTQCRVANEIAYFKFEVTSAADITFILIDLSGFDNPSSASVPIALLQRKTEGGALLESTSLKLTNLITDKLIGARATPLNNQIGKENAMIEIWIKIKSELPQNGNIVVTFGPYNPLSSEQTQLPMFTSNRPKCTGLQNIQHRVQCRFSRESGQLVLSSLNGMSSESELRFKVNSFRNPFDGRPRSDMKVQTQDSNGYDIDTIQNVSYQVSEPKGFQNLQLVLKTPTVSTLSAYTITYSMDIPANPGCRLKIKAPKEFDLKSTFNSVSGYNTFAEAHRTARLDPFKKNTIVIDGCQEFTETSRNADTLDILYIRNPNAIMDTDPFTIEFYAVRDGEEYLTATDNTTLRVFENQLASGTISGVKVEPLGSTVISERTALSFEFRPVHTLPVESEVEIEIPRGPDDSFSIDDDDKCQLLGPYKNTVSRPKSCVVRDQVLTVKNLFGSRQLAEGSVVQFGIGGVTNPFSVHDVGIFKIRTYEVHNDKRYLVDSVTQGGLYSASEGQILFKNLTLHTDNYMTYDTGSTYTISFIPRHKIPRFGIINVEFPVQDFGLTSVPTRGGAFTIKVGKRDKIKLIQVRITKGLGTIQITDAFTEEGFDPTIEKEKTIFLTIGNVRNPRSTKPSESLSIDTADVKGNVIDRTDMGLTVAMRELGMLNTVVVVPQSRVNGDVTTYQIHVNSFTPLRSGDYFQIKFPNQVSIPSGPTCAPTEYLNDVTCTRVKGKTLKAKLSFGVGKMSGGRDFQFSVSGIVNPPNTIESEAFTDIIITDDEGFPVADYKRGKITVETRKPAMVQTAQLRQSNDAGGLPTVYTLIFRTANPMPRGSAMLITYPPRIKPTEKFVPMERCEVNLISAAMTNITCEMNRKTQELKLYPITEDINKGEQIKITLGKFNNPMTAGSDSFRIETYTDRKFIHIIDKVVDGMIPGIKCNLPCLGCQGAQDSDKCTSCYQDGTTNLPFLFMSSCLRECPEDGYFPNSQKVCTKCHDSCETCATFDQCLSCSQIGGFPYYHRNKCVKDCPRGTYPDPKTGMCQKCNVPCKECTGPANGECLSCQQIETNPLIFLQENTCKNKCEPGSISLKYKCIPCTGRCKECLSTTQECTTCKKPFLNVGTQCVGQCPPKYLANLKLQKCEGCDPNCKPLRCVEHESPFQDQICMECSKGFILFKDRCYKKCPEGFEPDRKKGIRCAPIIFGKIYPPKIKPPEPINPLMLLDNCKALGKTKTLIYFPCLILLILSCLMVFGSYTFDKYTHKTHAIVALSSPVFSVSLWLQLLLAFTTEGVDPTYACADFSGGDPKNPTKGKVNVFVVWVTLLVFVIHTLINMLMFCYMVCSKKIKNDKKLQEWREKPIYNQTWKLTIFLALIFHSLTMNLQLSNFIGRKRYDTKFDKKTHLYRPLQYASIALIIFVYTPIVLLNISSLGVYTWGSQFHIALVDTLLIGMFCMCTVMVSFKYAKDEMRKEEEVQRQILRDLEMEQLKELSIISSQQNIENLTTARERGPMSISSKTGGLGKSLIAASYQTLKPLSEELIEEDEHKSCRSSMRSLRSVKANSTIREAPEVDENEGEEVLDSEELEDVDVSGLSDDVHSFVDLDGSKEVVSAPLDPECGNFNSNDVLGDVSMDENQTVKVITDKDGELVDKLGRSVNSRGYRIDSFGNILNLKDELVLPKHELRYDNELPLPLALHKFNFNANDIRGNYEPDLTPNNPKRDLNGRRMNKFGFLCSPEGHVVNRNKRRILHKAYLDKVTGDFPALLNYKGVKFCIKDVCGLLLRDADTGEPVMKKDKWNNKYWDRKGRQVNRRGYLVDMSGNVVNENGKKIFNREGLLKDGEIPKIFPFTKFNEKEVKGQFGYDPSGNPILKESRKNKPYFLDDNGKQVNKMGFLVNNDGDIVDSKNKRIFRKAILEDGGMNIPEVFRAGRGLIKKDSHDSFQQLMNEVENIAHAQQSTYEEESPAKLLEQDSLPIDMPGDTSMESEMGVTPAQYNKQNMRFSKDSGIFGKESRHTSKQKLSAVKHSEETDEDEGDRSNAIISFKKEKRPEGKRKKRRKDTSPMMIKKLQFMMDKREKFDSRANFGKMSKTYRGSMGALSNWSRKKGQKGSGDEMEEANKTQPQQPNDTQNNWKKASLRTAPQMDGFATSTSFNKVAEKRQMLLGKKQKSIGPVSGKEPYPATANPEKNNFINMHIDRAKETFDSMGTNAQIALDEESKDSIFGGGPETIDEESSKKSPAHGAVTGHCRDDISHSHLMYTRTKGDPKARDKLINSMIDTYTGDVEIPPIPEGKQQVVQNTGRLKKLEDKYLPKTSTVAEMKTKSSGLQPHRDALFKSQTDTSVIVEEDLNVDKRLKKNLTNKDFDRLKQLNYQMQLDAGKKLSKGGSKPPTNRHYAAMNAWSSMTNTDKKQQQEEKLWESLQQQPESSVQESEDVILLKGSKNVDMKRRLKQAGNDIISPRAQRNATTIEESKGGGVSRTQQHSANRMFNNTTL